MFCNNAYTFSLSVFNKALKFSPHSKNNIANPANPYNHLIIQFINCWTYQCNEIKRRLTVWKIILMFRMIKSGIIVLLLILLVFFSKICANFKKLFCLLFCLVVRSWVVTFEYNYYKRHVYWKKNPNVWFHGYIVWQ